MVTRLLMKAVLLLSLLESSKHYGHMIYAVSLRGRAKSVGFGAAPRRVPGGSE